MKQESTREQAKINASRVNFIFIGGTGRVFFTREKSGFDHMRVFACMASSLDGKIGPADVDRFVAIGSKHDMKHLISLRDQANGIIFGANTFRTWPKPHRGNDPDRRVHHFILSRSMDLDPNLELFQDPTFPVTILTTGEPGPALPEHIDIVTIPEPEETMSFALSHISSIGVDSLLVEGGGQVLHQMIEAKLLHELYLTVVPTLIGQPRAPGLVGGRLLTVPHRLDLLSSQQVGGETYLHLKFNYL